MLILDEPTNHLDVDAREALVQALNAYDGAVILVSHDRHMVELTADRLVLVDGGTAKEYAGSMEDYIAFVLAGDGGGEGAKTKAVKKDDKPQLSAAAVALQKKAHEAEALVAKLTKLLNAVDRAMADPSTAEAWLSRMNAAELAKQHAQISKKLDAAEAVWFQVSESLETA
jgi:ATP-binding cassette subfamily F protein 3